MVEKIGITIALVTSILTCYNLYLKNTKLRKEIEILELEIKEIRGK